MFQALVSEFGITVSEYRSVPWEEPAQSEWVRDVDNFPLPKPHPKRQEQRVTLYEVSRELVKRGWSTGQGTWRVSIRGSRLHLTSTVHVVTPVNPA